MTLILKAELALLYCSMDAKGELLAEWNKSVLANFFLAKLLCEAQRTISSHTRQYDVTPYNVKTTAKASHQKFKEQLMMFWQGTVRHSFYCMLLAVFHCSGTLYYPQLHQALTRPPTLLVDLLKYNCIEPNVKG